MKSEYFIWFILLSFAVLRIQSTNETNQDGSTIRLEGTVENDPNKTSYSQGIEVEGYYVYLPLYPELSYGDHVALEGVLENGIVKDVTLLSYKINRSHLFTFRRNLISFYNSSLPKPHSSLVAGMVLGTKSLISQNVWEKFKKSGTAHVVVASGMNISMVANFSLNILVRFMHRNRAVLGTLLVIWLYAVLAGFDAPIVRAALMASIAFGGMVSGRMRYTVRIFVLSAIIMVIFRPRWIYDLGFILSFTATGSLLLFESRIRSYLSWVPKFVREDLSTTLAAQIGVAPILLVTFGTINVLAPFANILILWTVVPITIVGMGAGIISFLSNFAGTLLIYVIYPLTVWFYLIVSIF